jgi:hypothetical protein
MIQDFSIVRNQSDLKIMLRGVALKQHQVEPAVEDAAVFGPNDKYARRLRPTQFISGGHIIVMGIKMNDVDFHLDTSRASSII